MSVITWSDVVARYPEMDKLPNGTSPEVQNNLILMAESGIHGKLASRYSVPFSSNNYTAKDLMVDQLYVQTQLTRQPEKAAALSENLYARLDDLLAGKANMISSTGAVALTMVGDTVWSSTQSYHPVFGMGDIERSIVSSDQVSDEISARGETA